MLGNTLVGLRLKDLRSVLRWLRTVPEIDAKRIGVWGDSFAPENGPERRLDVPLGIGEELPSAEPLGPLLALLAALFEDDVAAVVARGGLIAFRSTLQSQFVCIPHDVVVPGLLTAGDVSDLAAGLAPSRCWSSDSWTEPTAQSRLTQLARRGPTPRRPIERSAPVRGCSSATAPGRSPTGSCADCLHRSVRRSQGADPLLSVRQGVARSLLTACG